MTDVLFDGYEPEELRLVEHIRGWTDEALAPIDAIAVAREVARRNATNQGLRFTAELRDGLRGRRLVALMAAVVGVLALSAALLLIVGTRPATPIEPAPKSDVIDTNFPYGAIRPIAAGRHVLPAGYLSGPFELAFTLDAPVEGHRNQSLIALRTDQWEVQVWWLVTAVFDGDCKGAAASISPTSPSTTEAYEQIRSMPIFTASPERAYRVAGQAGRVVDLSLVSDWKTICPGSNPNGDDRALLTSAGRGVEAGHIILPEGWLMRLATVEIGDQGLLITSTGKSSTDLDAAAKVLDSFEYLPTPTSTRSAAPTP